MHDQRVLTLKHDPGVGRCVIYVMSRDQRAHDNHALLAAQQYALTHKLPLIVCFNLLSSLSVRAYEHFSFMLDGLQEVSESLRVLRIPFLMTYGDAEETLSRLCALLEPQALYFDFSPLHHARTLTKRLGKLTPEAYVVDTHNSIPAWVASKKQEFAAHTFRPKVHALLSRWLVEPDTLQAHPYQLQDVPTGISFDDARQYIQKLPHRGLEVAFGAGEATAMQQLHNFIDTRLADYAQRRNDIAVDFQSNLSPYLHFGQVSGLRVALEVIYATKTQPLLFSEAAMPKAGDQSSMIDGMNALFEEMIVRKELSDNFCLYTSDYLTLDGAPEWAHQTLDMHRTDVREYLYSLDELTAAKTHDLAWNAAQTQLTRSGKIHGYMRMYWAKKILEWTSGPEEAVAHTIYLNDAYSIDGGDPNGYVGILWAIAGLHDRPWTERSVFGKIRYMNEAGLKRKFKLEQYVQQWATDERTSGNCSVSANQEMSCKGSDS